MQYESDGNGLSSSFFELTPKKEEIEKILDEAQRKYPASIIVASECHRDEEQVVPSLRTAKAHHALPLQISRQICSHCTINIQGYGGERFKTKIHHISVHEKLVLFTLPQFVVRRAPPRQCVPRPHSVASTFHQLTIVEIQTGYAAASRTRVAKMATTTKTTVHSCI